MTEAIGDTLQAVQEGGANGGRQWKTVDRVMRTNGYQPQALIETLHAVQDAFGYIDRTAMQRVAHALHVPLSQVYAVTTFYHAFSLKPSGKHTCVICTGTACYIGGSPSLLEALRAHTGIVPGQTSDDGQVSLLTARCLGSCGLAPAAVFDGKVCGKLQPSDIIDQLNRWGEHDAVT